MANAIPTCSVTTINRAGRRAELPRESAATSCFAVRPHCGVNGSGVPTDSGDEVDQFVYDSDDITLRLDGAGSLKNRYLHGPAVDQVLADEDVTRDAAADDRVLWALADHQGSVRQLVNNARGLISTRPRRILNPAR